MPGASPPSAAVPGLIEQYREPGDHRKGSEGHRARIPTVRARHPWRPGAGPAAGGHRFLTRRRARRGCVTPRGRPPTSRRRCDRSVCAGPRFPRGFACSEANREPPIVGFASARVLPGPPPPHTSSGWILGLMLSAVGGPYCAAPERTSDRLDLRSRRRRESTRRFLGV
jgi:hypothetical protein